MTEQAFCDGMLWVFAVTGGLMLTFFIILIVGYCAVNIYEMYKDWQSRKPCIKIRRDDLWQAARRKR